MLFTSPSALWRREWQGRNIPMPLAAPRVPSPEHPGSGAALAGYRPGLASHSLDASNNRGWWCFCLCPFTPELSCRRVGLDSRGGSTWMRVGSNTESPSTSASPTSSSGRTAVRPPIDSGIRRCTTDWSWSFVSRKTMKLLHWLKTVRLTSAGTLAYDQQRHTVFPAFFGDSLEDLHAPCSRLHQRYHELACTDALRRRPN